MVCLHGQGTVSLIIKGKKKLLSLEKTKKTGFYLVFCSFIRNFAAAF